jgi:hypothetical protein
LPDKVIATAFANSGAIITGSLVIIFGADIPIAGLLALLAELDALLLSVFLRSGV